MPPRRRKSSAPAEDDPQKIAARRRANREAATRCRQRRRESYNKLKQDYLEIDCANVAKQEEIRQLMKVKEQLEAILRGHRCVLQGVSSPASSSPAPASLGAPRPAEATSPPGETGQSLGVTGEGNIGLGTEFMGESESSSVISFVSAPQDLDTTLSDTTSDTTSLLSTQGGATGLVLSVDDVTSGLQLPLAAGPDMDRTLDDCYETAVDLETVISGNLAEHSYCQGSQGSLPGHDPTQHRA